MVSNWASVLAGIATTLTSLLGAVHGLPTSNAAAVALAPGVTDTVTIADASGAGETNYPFQFGRPFVQGEITNYPQVLINGTPVLTQADVKNRYPDGSVKFAIMSVVIPTIAANGSLTLSFQNQSTGNNTALTKTQMLASNFNFDAGIQISDGSGHSASASARTMLQNGDYTVWTSGPVATTILLADDSAARKYDMGFDSYRSVRPRFYATFWPATNQVTVRYVGENGNTETLEDLAYNLTLTLGATSPQTVYTQSMIHNLIGQRWNRVFWIGGAPEQKVNVNHNFPYLAATILVPNYDPTVSISPTAVASDYSYWQAADKTIGGSGFWNRYMPTTGGRGDIAPMPSWTVMWLYTGDWREREIALTQADLADSWWLQMREGDPTKFEDKAQTISALGKPINAYDRPTLWLFDPRKPVTPQDDIQMIGPRIVNSAFYPDTGDGWVADGAHQPDPFYAQYLLTGDYFYLEEMQFWGMVDSVTADNCPGVEWYCRGPGAGISDGQIRGNAWMLRNRVNPAVISPDSDPLKGVFNSMVDDALALWEGQRNITGTPLQSNSEWQFGYDSSANSTSGAWGPYGISPLHFWGIGGGNDYDPPIDSTKVAGVASPWMQNFLIIELGRTAELGYKAGPMLSWLGQNLVGQLTDPGFNKWLADGYRMPSFKSGNTHFNTWADVLASYYPSYQTVTTWTGYQCGSCYPGIAKGASAFLIGLPNGPQAISNLSAMLATTPNVDFNKDPSYDIVPRTNGATLPPPTTYVPPPASPTVTLSANLSSITAGQSTTLSWTSSNATSCTGTGFSANGTSGSASVTPLQTAVFSITCTGSGGSASDTTTITVTTAADTTKPNLAFTTPSNGATVSGTVNVSANATDNVGVTKVEFYADNVLGVTDTAAPYTWSWNTSGVGNGTHALRIKAYDAAGNTNDTGILVTLNNVAIPGAPTITFSAAPASIQTGSSVTLTWTATNASSCTGTGFTANNTSGTANVSPSETTTYAITCTGAGGSTSASAAVTVTRPPDTVAPTVSLGNPGSNVTGTVSLTASASDAVGVTRVEFYIDGTLINTDSSAPYTYSWNTVTVANGTHTLSAKAYDDAGNTGTSNQLTVSVQNTDTNTPTPPTPLPPPVSPGNPTPQGYTHSASSTAPRLGRTLRIGSTGSDVQQLQQYLNAIGFTVTVPGQETTYYGPGTAAAVSRFQEAHAAEILIPNGLTSGTGVVGPTTIAVISGTAVSASVTATQPVTNTPTYYGRVVKYGFSGSDIAVLQRQLIAAGYLKAGSDSGYFGSLTRAAVRKFQCDRGLVCSGDEISTGWGLVGARTRAALVQ